MQWKIIFKYVAIMSVVLITTMAIFVFSGIMIERYGHKVPDWLNTLEKFSWWLAQMAIFVHLGYTDIAKPYRVSAIIGFITWLILAIYYIHVMKMEYENYMGDLVFITLIAINGTAIGRAIRQQILYYRA